MMQQVDISLFSIALVLFLIMDPFGNVSSLLKALDKLSPQRQRYVVLREMFFALVMMSLFNLIGEYIFSVLELSDATVRFSSAVILFLTAIKIIFPTSDSPRAQVVKGEEPFIIPIAIPLVAGPSLLATIMLYAHMGSCQGCMWTAMLASWVAATAIFLLAKPLRRLLTDNGLLAIERLMGMILVLLSIQRFNEGLRLFFENIK